MKPSLLSVVLLSFGVVQSLGQGSLTPPPGPPAPTMKTLDQVEPRIIVNATNTPGDAANTFIISAPGSYYLTGNLTGDTGKHGISIQANDVSLDLNGFALISGGGAALRGVDAAVALNNFQIRNGTVRGWSEAGVGAGAATTQAEKLRLVENAGATGLVVGNGSIVKDCVATANAIGFFLPDRTQASGCIATTNTGVGFNCTNYVNLVDCTSSRNGGHGIVALGNTNITRCSATRNIPFGHGMFVGVGSNITDSTASQNGLAGIQTGDHCAITNCVADYNGGGIVGPADSNSPGCTVTSCTASGNGGPGIFFYRGTITNCTGSANGGTGIYADGGSVTASGAHFNGEIGIFGTVISHSSANHNGERGIHLVLGGAVNHSNASYNGQHGIYAPNSAVTACFADINQQTGIHVAGGTVTNCMARNNGDHGINGTSAVVAFCRASGNNNHNNGSVDILGTNGSRTGNLPAP